MSEVKYYLVKLPDEVGEDLGMAWMGGPLQASERRGYVWLTTPGGKRVMEVPVTSVQPSDQEGLARRLT